METYTSEEKRQLLQLARTAIESRLKGQALPDTGALSEKLRNIRSSFVTLHKKEGNLRGCIGNINAFEPLADNIVHNALNSAFEDPRFPPLISPDELSELNIEISILTLPEKISSIEKFEVGKHGIILSKNGRSAVFLPQVASEQGWDKETTLTHLSLKAGLSAGAWREPGTQFQVFEAIVFSESLP